MAHYTVMDILFNKCCIFKWKTITNEMKWNEMNRKKIYIITKYTKVWSYQLNSHSKTHCPKTNNSNSFHSTWWGYNLVGQKTRTVWLRNGCLSNVDPKCSFPYLKENGSILKLYYIRWYLIHLNVPEFEYIQVSSTIR